MNQNRYSKIFTKKKVASSAVCVALAISLFAGCAHFESIEYSQEISEENPQTVEAFDQFINDIFETEVTENTINLHFTISDPEKYGITDYPVTLGDLSIDAMADSNARLENYLSGLNSFSYTELTLNQQLTYDILENYFKLQLDMADMYLYDELLRPSTGVQAQLPILYEEYSFNSKKDVEDYLKLLALTDEYFDQIISFEKEKADAGLFMSDFACQNIIDQCNAFIADSDNHYLIETFNTRIDKLTGLTQSEKDHYRLQNEKILHEHIFPAYENLAAALTDLLGSGTNETDFAISRRENNIMNICSPTTPALPKVSKPWKI